MLIGNDFVFLNFPKTGTSFLRKAIKYVAKKDCKFIVSELLLPNTRNLAGNFPSDHHGTYTQIPYKYKEKFVFSIARDPLDLLWSHHDYGLWRKRRCATSTHLKYGNDSFIDESINQMIQSEREDIEERLGFYGNGFCNTGLLAIKFIQMYAYDPQNLIKNIASEEICAVNIPNEFPQIKLLRQENLICDLKSFLSQRVSMPNIIENLDTFPRSNVSNPRTSLEKRRNSKSANLYAAVKLSLLYDVYEYWGVFYNRPSSW